MSNTSSGNNDDFIGQILAERYEIVSFIGRGAMGSVYKARQVAIGRDVAVKMMSNQSIDERATQRFVKEAMAMSALTHPHLISLIDFGETADKIPFLVMEYLDGTTLTKLIDKNGLPIQTALRIAEQIAEGLAHAHARGFIHRDLKPSNVMLIGDNQDFVKIVDLGIVKALDKDGAEAMRLTHTGEIFGSPLYMSPEQCLGQALDERSDIYALGCLTYETITGTPPIIGENFVQTVYRHVHDIPSMMQDVRPDLAIPAEVESLVARALSKNRDDRHASMKELKEALGNARNQCTAATIGAQPFLSPSAVAGGSATMGTRVSQGMPASNPPGPPSSTSPVRPFLSSGSGSTNPGANSGPPHSMVDTQPSSNPNPIAALLNQPALAMGVVAGVAALLVFAGIGIAAMFTNFRPTAPTPAVTSTTTESQTVTEEPCPTPTSTNEAGKKEWKEPLIEIAYPKKPHEKKVVLLATEGADDPEEVDPPEDKVGDVIVDINPKSGPMTLVCASQAPVNWVITGATQNVEAVKLLGFRKQTQSGIDPKKVLAVSKDQPDPAHKLHLLTVRVPDVFSDDFNAEKKNWQNDSDFLVVKDEATEAAGAPITQYQGKRVSKRFNVN